MTQHNTPELADLLAVLPESPSVAREIARGADPRIFNEARDHGVLQVIYEAVREDVPPSVRQMIEHVLAVRALENELALRGLAQCLDAFRNAGVRCAVLKGPILAERLYGSALGRPSSDIDVLVDQAAFEPALSALAGVGYERARAGVHAQAGPQHVVLFHRAFPNLELHFHAHAGFGRRIEAAGLLTRAVFWKSDAAGREIPVLAPADELVYLAVHAAAHRFTRLVWLYDLKLLVGRLSRTEIETAASRARAWGFRRVLAFTCARLVALGVAPDVLRPFGRIGFARRAVLAQVTPEPRATIGRLATRLVYANVLCDNVVAGARYTVGATVEYLQRPRARS